MSSLSARLLRRAHEDGARVALSFKERGSWACLDWSGVELSLASMRRALSEAGFDSGAVLVVSSEPNVRTLLAVFAALSLGGSISEVGELSRSTAPSAPRWGFARNDAELSALLDREASGTLNGILFHGQPLASSARAGLPLLSYSAPLAAHPTGRSTSAERSLLELPLSDGPQAKQLLRNWLERGFELGVPERAASVERDAGELGVTLRIASSRGWEGWARGLRARFAAPGSHKRRLLDWALAVSAEPASRSQGARLLSAVLIVNPLRRALGLNRWRCALSLDAPPAPEAVSLLGGLGVRFVPSVKRDAEPLLHSERAPASDSAPILGNLARQGA